jgi:hypothetical protein
MGRIGQIFYATTPTSFPELLDRFIVYWPIMCDGFWNHTTTVVLLPWISTFCKVNRWLLSIFYGVAFVIIQEISMWEWFTQHGYSS